MTAREMSPEELAEVRERCKWCIDSATASMRPLLAHLDALAIRLKEAEWSAEGWQSDAQFRTCERDEARAEVAALTARLEAAERERNEWRSVVRAVIDALGSSAQANIDARCEP